MEGDKVKTTDEEDILLSPFNDKKKSYLVLRDCENCRPSRPRNPVSSLLHHEELNSTEDGIKRHKRSRSSDISGELCENSTCNDHVRPLCRIENDFVRNPIVVSRCLRNTYCTLQEKFEIDFGRMDIDNDSSTNSVALRQCSPTNHFSKKKKLDCAENIVNYSAKGLSHIPEL